VVIVCKEAQREAVLLTTLLPLVLRLRILRAIYNTFTPTYVFLTWCLIEEKTQQKTDACPAFIYYPFHFIIYEGGGKR
jgi:hypothetical protein